MAKKVFISYRRDDTAPAAGRLYDRFCMLLGKRNVFLDVGAIDAGENFETKIKASIGESGAVLVLIGKGWLAKGSGNQPRLWEAGDQVRAEVQASLLREALTLPVLVDGAVMPQAESLPQDIDEITKLNALPLRHETFDSDADHIARKVLGLAPGELLWENRGATARKIWGAVAGGGLAAAGLIALALIHMVLLHQPVQSTIGEAQTTMLIAAVLFSGVLAGAVYGGRRRL